MLEYFATIYYNVFYQKNKEGSGMETFFMTSYIFSHPDLVILTVVLLVSYKL